MFGKKGRALEGQKESYSIYLLKGEIVLQKHIKTITSQRHKQYLDCFLEF